MGIRITTEKASLAIQSTKAKLNLKSAQPRMSIQTVPARMNVDRKSPSFRVNWQKFRNEVGVKSPAELMKTISDDSRQRIADTTARIVNDGNQMKRVETGEDMVVRLAQQENLSGGDYEVNVVSIPQTPPQVEWDEGHMKVDWSHFELSIEWDVPNRRIEGEFEPHTVEVKMRNYPKVKIEYIEDKKAKVDQKI
jgi:hypothetical protein